MDYRTYNEVPAYTQAQWDGDKLLNEDSAIKWSGKVPPPPIDTKVRVTFNKLGTGTVMGYFTEGGWLGLLVKFHKPPAWYTRQHNGNPLGHVFGVEFELFEDEKTA